MRWAVCALGGERHRRAAGHGLGGSSPDGRSHGRHNPVNAVAGDPRPRRVNATCRLDGADRDDAAPARADAAGEIGADHWPRIEGRGGPPDTAVGTRPGHGQVAAGQALRSHHDQSRTLAGQVCDGAPSEHRTGPGGNPRGSVLRRRSGTRLTKRGGRALGWADRYRRPVSTPRSTRSDQQPGPRIAPNQRRLGSPTAWHTVARRTRRCGWPPSLSATTVVDPATPRSEASQSSEIAASAGRACSVQCSPSDDLHIRWAVGRPPTATSVTIRASDGLVLRVGTAAARAMASDASGSDARPGRGGAGTRRAAPFGEIHDAGDHWTPVRLPPTATMPVKPSGARAVIRWSPGPPRPWRPTGRDAS